MSETESSDAAPASSTVAVDDGFRSFRTMVPLLLVAIVALAAYSNTFHVPFFLDDENSIVKNNVIKDLGTFLSGNGYAYNPRRFIGYLTVALNYRLSGLEVAGYHVVNLAIHVASGWLVFALGRLTLATPFCDNGGAAAPRARTFIPLFAALLFVAHPVQTQAVTYIIQRLASLATMFYLLSVVLYVRARLESEPGACGSPAPPRRALQISCYLGAVLAAGLAMKTKEIAFTLPFVIVLYECFFFRMTARKKLLFAAPMVLTILVVPLSVLGTNKPLGQLLSDISQATRVDTDISRLEYLFTQFRVIVTYLRLLIFPAHQNFDYDYPIYHSLGEPAVFLSLIVLLALAGSAVVLFFRSGSAARRFSPDSGLDPVSPALQRLISFGIVWFFITLAVESSFIPIVDVIFEHRVYLASPGAFLAFAALFFLLLRRVPQRGAAVAAGVVVVSLAATTFARNVVWGDAVRLCADTVQKSPNKARPHYNLALALQQRGELKASLLEAETAIRLAPKVAEPYNLAGCIYGAFGVYDKATAALKEAVRLDPAIGDAHVNLGDAYRLQGMLDQALGEYALAQTLTPTDADVYNKIGLIHRQAGRREIAVQFFQSAVSLAPERSEYRVNLVQASYQ